VLVPPQAAKHLNFEPTATQSLSVRHTFEHALVTEVQPASEKFARPRHESPAAQSPSAEQPAPAGATELLQATPNPSTDVQMTIIAFDTRPIDILLPWPAPVRMSTAAESPKIVPRGRTTHPAKLDKCLLRRRP